MPNTNSLPLRPYQQRAKEQIHTEWEQGRLRTLLVLPTGTGKTIVFAAVAEDQVRAGDRVLITGTIIAARDAAHKRLVEALARGEELPVDLDGAVIYYVGPSPARPGRAIGAAGPTTAGRMDAYTPTLLAQGLRGMIGKGRRNAAVIASMKQHGAVYFGAIGGCGALLSKCIKKAEVIAYEDLGAEALRRLEVEDFPVTVIIDTLGNDLYETGRRAYLEQCNGKQPH